jgi:hypothetical protein
MVPRKTIAPREPSRKIVNERDGREGEELGLSPKQVYFREGLGNRGLAKGRVFSDLAPDVKDKIAQELRQPVRWLDLKSTVLRVAFAIVVVLFCEFLDRVFLSVCHGFRSSLSAVARTMVRTATGALATDKVGARVRGLCSTIQVEGKAFQDLRSSVPCESLGHCAILSMREAIRAQGLEKSIYDTFLKDGTKRYRALDV